MKLDPKKTYIVLFTRGRIGKQKSLRYFSKSMVESTIVVTADSEKKELRASLKSEGFNNVLKVMSFKDEYKLISKRYMMAEWLKKQGARYFFMCDDDASLSVLIGDRYRSTRSPEGAEVLEKLWTTKIPKLWKTYTVLGMSANSRNNRNFFIEKHTDPTTGLFVQDSTKNGLFFGAHVDWFVEQFRWLKDNDLLQDVAYMDIMTNLLGVLDGRVGRIYNIAWATTFDDKKSSGGMNLYRTHKTNSVAVTLLMSMFPGIVSMRDQERIVFETFKLERHAWKIPEEWNPDKVDWKVWHSAVTNQMKKVEDSVSGFKGSPVHKYVQRMIRRLEVLAKGEAETKLVLNGPTVEGAVCGKTTGESAVARARKLSVKGKLVSVKITTPSMSKEQKEVAHSINVNIIRNWRNI